MTKIIQRHDTAANWTAANPVLAAGEMGVETDTNKFKFGNGSTVWSELAYATSGSGGSVDAYTKAETDELLTEKQDILIASTGISLTEVGEIKQTPYKMTGQGIWSDASGDIQISGTDSSSSTTYGSRPVYRMYEGQDLYTNDWQFSVIYGTGSSSNNCFGAGLEFNIDNAAYNTQITRTLFSQVDRSTTYVKLYCGSSTYTVTVPSGYSQVEVLMKHTAGSKEIKFYAKEVSQDEYQYLGSNEILNSTDVSATIYLGNTYAPTSTQNNGRTTCLYSNIRLLNPYSEKNAYNISAITATSSNLGIVQPDGTTITVNESGVISTVGGTGSVDAYTKAETDELLTSKQDKLTAKAPLKIATEEYKELNVDIIRTDGTLSENFVYTPPTAVGENLPYIETKDKNIPFSTADTWEIVLRYVPSSSQNDFLGAFWNDFIGVYTYNNQNNIQLEIHGDNVSISTKIANIPSFANTLCYIKLEFTGTAYVLSHSLDGIQYTTLYSSTNSNKVTNNGKIGFCGSNGTTRCTGDIYLTDSYYKINGVTYPLAVIKDGALVVSAASATTSSLGVVKPDGTSITVDSNGQLSCTSNILSDSNFIEFCTTNAAAIKAALGLS